VAQPFEVQQRSMFPTIVDGEYILIDKLTTRWDGYDYGEVIVFEPPGGSALGSDGIPFIKRIVALPGDTVDARQRAGLHHPAGRRPGAHRGAVRGDRPRREHRADDPDRRRPAPSSGRSRTDSYFVMGDNRSASQDSRAFGPIDEDLILGRAWLRYFPLDRIGLIEQPDYPALDLGAESMRLGAPGSPAARAGSSATIHSSISRPYSTSASAPNHSASSASAVSGASDAWMRLRSPLTPRSPRIVPGSASFGIVLPTIFRTTAMASGPSIAIGRDRTGRDELDEAVVEVLPGVDGVVLLGHLARDGEKAQADDLEALALEAADDLADEAALHGVGLGEDESALHADAGS
jgi:signal peptidase I